MVCLYGYYGGKLGWQRWNEHFKHHMKQYKTLVDISGFIGSPIIKKGTIFTQQKDKTYLQEDSLTNDYVLGLGEKYIESNPKIFELIKV